MVGVLVQLVDVLILMAITNAMVCVDVAALVGPLCVGTAVFIDTVRHMMTAVLLEGFIHGLASELHMTIGGAVVVILIVASVCVCVCVYVCPVHGECVEWCVFVYFLFT